MALLREDEVAEWCNRFVLAPDPKCTVHLCLDPSRLNLTLIRPVHRGLRIHGILSKLTNVYYMTIEVASSRYHNLKHDIKFIITNTHLHVNFAEADSPGYHLGWCQQATCSGKQSMSFSRTYQMCLVLQMTFSLGYDASTRGHNKALKQVMQIWL